MPNITNLHDGKESTSGPIPLRVEDIGSACDFDKDRNFAEVTAQIWFLLRRFPGKFKRLVHIGCGDGRYLVYLRSLGLPLTLIGADVPGPVLKKAQVTFSDLTLESGEARSVQRKYASTDTIFVTTSALGNIGPGDLDEFLSYIGEARSALVFCAACLPIESDEVYQIKPTTYLHNYPVLAKRHGLRFLRMTSHYENSENHNAGLIIGTFISKRLLDKPARSLSLAVKAPVDAIVYITGQMRSGTTLLGTLLDEQDDCRIAVDQFRVSGAMRAAFGEIISPSVILTHEAKMKFFVAFLNASMIGAQAVARLTRLKEFLSSPIEDIVQRGAARANDVDRLPDFDTASQFYARMLVAAREGTERIIGNKETRGEILASQLCKGKIKGIIILRDPRDSALSYVKKGKSDPSFRDSLPILIDHWRTGFSVWSSERLQNILCLRYEDLILDTGETMRRLGEFLSISIKNTAVAMNNSSFGDVSKGALQAAPVARWKQLRDDPVVQEVSKQLAAEIAAAGYDIG